MGGTFQKMEIASSCTQSLGATIASTLWQGWDAAATICIHLTAHSRVLMSSRKLFNICISFHNLGSEGARDERTPSDFTGSHSNIQKEELGTPIPPR